MLSSSNINVIAAGCDQFGIPIRSEGHAALSVEWFAMLVGIEDVHLEWHSPEEQQALTHKLPAQPPKKLSAA